MKIRWPFVLRSTYEAEVLAHKITDKNKCRAYERTSVFIRKWQEQCRRAGELEAQLHQAQKNDTPKDPITGKFMKKAKEE